MYKGNILEFSLDQENNLESTFYLKNIQESILDKENFKQNSLFGTKKNFR